MSNKIENSKLILELFNYKKGLNMDQEDVERQINYHLSLFQCDNVGKSHSQRQIINSLTERLKPMEYDLTVKQLVENVNSIVKEDELFYDLEDLYRVLENDNQGQVLSHLMEVVLSIITESNEREKQVMILNELALYDWHNAVKNFLFKYTTNPRDRQNISSQGGKAEPVVSIIEKVKKEEEDGFLSFIGDKFFYISESTIEPCDPSVFFTERDELFSLSLLQKALEIGTIAENKIAFKIDEDLDLAISFDDSSIYINNEKQEKGSSLESIFDSPIIPFMRKDVYPVVAETVKNIDKFAEIDIVQKVSNVTNAFLECFAFNYKEKMYVYSMDKRSGHNFYEYDSATMLCNEMNQSLGYDLSLFFKDKFNDETQAKIDLENKEKYISHKLSEISENITKIEICGLLETSDEIKVAYEALKEEKSSAEEELFNIKSTLSSGKYIVG